MYQQCLENIKSKRPIVNSIMNAVSINDCANAIIAVGASPIMADDPKEAKEIAHVADSFVLNMGMPNDRKLKSMNIILNEAKKLNKPVALDPVGIGVSVYRKNAVLQYIGLNHLGLIRCNKSELITLWNLIKSEDDISDIKSKDLGISAFAEYNESEIQIIAKKLALACGAIVAVSGKSDIVTNGTKSAIISGGSAMLESFTGSGCMLSAISAAFMGANPENLFESVIASHIMVGIAAKKAEKTISGKK